MPQANNNSASTAYVASGMPALDIEGKQTSFFEFWPTWLIYLPVVVQSLALAIWHRSLTLPLIANPQLPLSGMVGIPKSELLNTATDECQRTILTWFIHTITAATMAEQVSNIEKEMANLGLSYPLVCKPDIGCRGSGVKLVHHSDELLNCIRHYPEGAAVMLQKLASWEPEAGVFYVREPNQSEGEIISLALKYSPYVVGDGKHTLAQLITQDARAGALKHLYFERHANELNTVLAEGETFRLVFSASHCRGAIFRDAAQYISPELNKKIDQLMQQIPGFYYGRLDIKFRDIDSLQQGENLEIIEINSASSESLHIWDRKTPLSAAISSLLFQYRTLYKLGAQNKAKGFVPPPLSAFLAAWKKERTLNKFHPTTD